MYKLPFVATLR